MNKLFMIHCGFYDSEVCQGIYENHVNLFVAAKDFAEARSKVKALPEFKIKKMHVDGAQEIVAVQGFNVELKETGAETQLISYKQRDLAPVDVMTSAPTSI